MVERIAMQDPKGYLSPEEVEKILKACKTYRDYLIVMILWRTGIRVSELLSITRDRISFEKNNIIIKALKKKGNRERVIYLDEKTMQLIRKYVEKRKNKGDDKVFPITRQMVFYIIRKLGKEAGVEYIGKGKIHPHHFRHSFCMTCIKKGMDIRKLQMLVGHSSVETTASYLQYGSKDLREEYDKVWG